jgi:LysR family transcriptional regulator (chromosome initiation inhibitor)
VTAAGTLVQLETLVAVVDCGGFVRAAARLGVTQSAVSQRIRGLEEAAGAVLLQRTVPTAPTRAGLPVLQAARRAHELGRQLDELVASVRL